jgi:aryl-alcohol dehydrogenase
MDTTAAIARGADAKFAIETVTLDEPRPDEIIVRIVGVGICHTDLFARAGNIIPLPAVLGHEGSGVVERVGSKVRKVAPGDHVVISFRSCGHCPACEDGHPSYCRWLPALNYMGTRSDGSRTITSPGTELSANFFGQSSFAGHALTSERNVVKVATDLPLETLGPLGCGIQTGAGAVMRALRCEKGSTLLIAGGGTVGLSAVMASRIQECARVIVVEPLEARRDLAMELGATDTIDPIGEPDLVAAVRRCVETGADYALDTTGRIDTLEVMLACLAPSGTLGLLGIAAPGATIASEVNGLITFGHAIRGINLGDSEPDTFIPELIALYLEGRFPFDRLIRTYPMRAINQAIDDQRAGLCVKPVLIP